MAKCGMGGGLKVMSMNGFCGFVVGSWVMSLFFFFKQKTAYEMCGRDWSSDVCSSDRGRIQDINHLWIYRISENFDVVPRTRNGHTILRGLDRKSVV